MTSKDPDVVLGKRIYVKEGVLSKLEIESRYILDIFNEAGCGKCANRPNRPNDLCEGCPNYQGKFKFFKRSRLKSTTSRYVGLPIADLNHVRKRLRKLPNYNHLRIKNNIRPRPMNHPLTFTGKLFGANAVDGEGNPRANQVEIVEQWLEKKIGVIQAPPRTGKTVIATHIACELGVKTVIMAHQYKLLKQFYDTFMGNAEDNRKAMTNAPELERKNGAGTSVFLCKTTAQLLKFGRNTKNWPDILLINNQKFPHKIKRVAQFLNNNYSLKVVDEVHQGAADAYARVLFAMHMPYSLALSATPRRKDELDRKSEFTVGPVVAKSQIISVAPTIETKIVKAIPDVDYKHWAYACKWARSSEERNRELLKEIFRDLQAGHKVIIVPVGSLAVQTILIDSINARIRKLRRREVAWRDHPYPLAIPLNAKSKQDETIRRVDDGRPCVLVAIQSMIKQGIDMQMPSMIYLNEPLSATRLVGAPMFQQLSFRVATPSARKPMAPVVKIWIDNISSFRGALTGLFFNEILPNSKPDATEKGPMYILGANTYAVMSQLKGQKRVKGQGFKQTSNHAKGGKWG